MENLQSDHLDTQNLYRDMQKRTGGEIYIGVVGPVRTGKSTFIKRFMDVAVLPYMEDAAQKTRAQDELPQSAGGRTITTTEPKFIPQEAVELKLAGEVTIRVRLVDCVGFMVEGAAGHLEDGAERLVKTPWYDHEIPFTQAAELGTRKVITDHSTIGVVVTTDGSFSDLPQETYLDAENQAISELKKLHKPFLVLVNSSHPSSRTAREAAERIEKQHSVAAMPVNCAQLSEEDIRQIMEQILYEFPVSEIQFYIPKWVEMLSPEHELKAQILIQIREHMQKLAHIRDITKDSIQLTGPYVQETLLDQIDLSSGIIRIRVQVRDEYYYKILSELSGITMESEYDLIHTMKELTNMKEQYVKVRDALEAVRSTGYGVVVPELSEIQIETPTVIRQGNKFGVKIRSKSPSIHMIKANIETEIAPIVGTEQQANDLIQYIGESSQRGESIWETNIFGKSIEQLVKDGISSKISTIGEESQTKLQDTMQKIVNDSKGGMVCIII